MSVREFTQWATSVVTIVTIFVMIAMVYKRVLSWRYVLLPLLVSFQLLAFYIAVFITGQTISEQMTSWSAIIRLETGIAFLVVLLAYWRNHNHNG